MQKQDQTGLDRSTRSTLDFGANIVERYIRRSQGLKVPRSQGPKVSRSQGLKVSRSQSLKSQAALRLKMLMVSILQIMQLSPSQHAIIILM